MLAAVKSAGTPSALGREIVSAYIRDYQGLGQRNVTQSAIDAQRTEAAMKALGDLGGLLSARFNRLQPEIRKVRSTLQAFDFSDFVDVVHMATLLQRSIRDREVRRACRVLRSAVAACVLANESFGESVKDAHGVSIWFPFSRDVYFDNRGKYLGLNFAKKHRGWISFLDAYFA